MSGRLLAMIERHEGLRRHVYKDSVGAFTIGVGRNVDSEHGGIGISTDEAYFLLENDVIRTRKELARSYAWFNDLDEIRQDALIDMHFNLGGPRFGSFKNMIAALEHGDYIAARDQMLDSKWARQVGARATELAMMVWRGEYLPDAG